MPLLTNTPLTSELATTPVAYELARLVRILDTAIRTTDTRTDRYLHLPEEYTGTDRKPLEVASLEGHIITPHGTRTRYIIKALDFEGDTRPYAELTIGEVLTETTHGFSANAAHGTIKDIMTLAITYATTLQNLNNN